MHVKICGTGSAVPDNELTNHDLEKMVETSDEWIRERTGIRARRIAEPDMAASDLAVIAARKALESATRTPQDMEMIIVATTTPDHIVFPSTGCLIQDRLGCPFTPAFDLSAACSGFVYGLSVATAYIRSGLYRRILFVSVDTLSRYLDWQDRGTCILFGDGAGALVLEASDDPAAETVLSFDLHADGGGKNMLVVPEGGSRTPFSESTWQNRRHYLTMDGPAVYKFAVNVIVDSLTKALDRAGLAKENIDFFIPHQANMRIIDFAAKKLGLRDEQVCTNLEKYGNTSSASIPLVLDELNRAGRLKRGAIIATVGFGAGLTWGSSILRW